MDSEWGLFIWKIGENFVCLKVWKKNLERKFEWPVEQSREYVICGKISNEPVDWMPGETERERESGRDALISDGELA